MAKEENTVFFHTSEGDQLINIDEQREIEEVIKRQINLPMEEEFNEEEINDDILEILNDEKLNDEINEEDDFDPDEDVPDLEGIDGYDEDLKENKIEDDQIFMLMNKLYSDYKKEDLNEIEKDKASIQLFLRYILNIYKKYINLTDNVEIKERIVEQFKDKDLLGRLLANYINFYQRFEAVLKDSFGAQESNFWKGLEDVIKYKFKEESPNLDKEEMKRYIENAKSAAIRTNKQTQKYLHNFIVRFMQILELAFIYGVYLINLDKLYRLHIDAEHLTFIEVNCSYLFPEFKETKIVIRDPIMMKEDQIGLVGLNNLLQYFLTEQKLTGFENIYILENLADAVVYKFGAMKGLTKYSELSAKYDLLNTKYNTLRKNDEILLKGYYSIINEISKRIKPNSQFGRYLRKTTLSNIKSGDKEIEVQFFIENNKPHNNLSYIERLPAIIKDFLEIDKLIHEK